jgi:hypothetical protein
MVLVRTAEIPFVLFVCERYEPGRFSIPKIAAAALSMLKVF